MTWTTAQYHDYELRRKRANLPPAGEVPHAKQCELPKELGGGDAGETQSPGCLHVRFTLCRVKLLDVDAKYGSCKDILDCVANSGLVAGDREDQITLEVRQEKVQHFKDESTLIEVFA